LIYNLDFQYYLRSLHVHQKIINLLQKKKIIMLSTVCVPELANFASKYSGMDSIDACLDPQRFQQWPHTIDYQYNSRGFRDAEWPENLTNAVWCLGDSFTAGIGSALAHTWVKVLATRSQQPTINVSMDGASNNWLARKCCEIYSIVQPKTLIVMWSYIHRRESFDTTQSDYMRRIWHCNTTTEQDYKNLAECRHLVKTHCAHSTIIELIIPNWRPGLSQYSYSKIRDVSWPALVIDIANHQQILDELANVHGEDTNLLLDQISVHRNFPELTQLIQVPQLDIARDGHHFDIVTSEWVSDQITQQLTHILKD
jgi:hypothetical protein